MLQSYHSYSHLVICSAHFSVLCLEGVPFHVAIVLYHLETHDIVLKLTLHYSTSLLIKAVFLLFAAFSSEELSAELCDFLLFLFLPAFIQRVSVTAVVTRPVIPVSRNNPCRSCTIQCYDALLHVHQRILSLATTI